MVAISNLAVASIQEYIRVEMQQSRATVEHERGEQSCNRAEYKRTEHSKTKRSRAKQKREEQLVRPERQMAVASRCSEN